MGKINITNVVNEAKISKFHVMLLILCSLLITFDSFDLVIYGSVVPSLMQDWGISAIEAGAIGSYGFFGMMLGAIFFGTLSDKFGRKNGLIISVIIFSLFTFFCVFAPGPITFSIFRFVAGVGIGGVMPNVIALITEYSPKRMHNKLISIIMCCFSIGGILGAVVGMYFIPKFGWQTVYWVALIPILFIPYMLKYLHDSPAFLLLKGKKEELSRVLKKVNSNVEISPSMDFELGGEEKEAGSPVMALFRNNRALATIMIWIAFFMCLLMINGVTTWLPKLMFTAGYALTSSLSFVIALNAGAIVGTLILGELADKYGVKKILIPMYFISAIALVLLGFKSNIILLYIIVAVTGACTMGAQNISYSFVAQYYPQLMRSTAVGFASGVGRIGGIIGPTFGGVLLSMNLSVQMNFLAFAIPGVIAGIAFIFVPLKAKKLQQQQEKDQPNPVV